MHQALRASLIITSLLACRANETAIEEDAIFGGRIDRTHLAVGRVGRIDGEDLFQHCSGTLIGPRTVLTAAHCLFHDGRRLFAPSLTFEVGGVIHSIARSSVNSGYDPAREEAWEDAALLRLRERSEVGPIPVSIDPPLEGVEAEVIGFGVTRANSPDDATGSGRRRRARITLDAVSEREIFYAAHDAGACYGDSGGPILQNGAVVGITSRGTALDCRGIDIAQRSDVLTVWIGSITRGDACIGWCE